MTRLSVAIWPPVEILRRLDALPRPPEPGVNWAAPEQLMLKLRPLGHLPDAMADPVAEALAGELDGAGPVTCVLGPETIRLAGQWLAAPVTGADELAAAVFEATAGLVPVTHPQPFRGSIVLARGRVPAALAGTPVDGIWSADVVTLVADRSAPGRPRSDILAEISLDGRSARR